MSWVYFNPNETGENKNDCIVRAIMRVTGQTWNKTYIDLCIQGFIEKDMPSINYVWHEYLKGRGFDRKIIPNICPKCYTVRDFCLDNPFGCYILAVENEHVVAVVDGDYYDSWDSGGRIPTFYWEAMYD